MRLIENILIVLCFLCYFMMIIPKTRRWVGRWFISTFLTMSARGNQNE